MTTLPVNIDATYADDPADASVQAHQQHHDVLHTAYNAAGSTRVWRSAALALSDSVWTVIGFDNETRDELSAHDNVTNNDRVTPGVAGRYRITGQAGVATATQMALRVMVNGSGGTRKAVVLTAPATASETVAQITTGLIDLGSTDYVQLWIIAFNFGGTTLDTPSEDSVWFEVERVS